MRQTNPNRTRNESAKRHKTMVKDSGDQHLLPEQETEESPHRPHRLDREDMNKILPSDRDKGDTGTH